jgi:NAD-dependent SIR2 family protein deacetylase
MRLSFLLGAGASFAYGIPMMRQFYERFIEYIHRRRSHCIPLLDRLTAGVSRPDLEILIDKLEQVRAIRPALAVIAETGTDLSSHLDQADDLRGYLDMFMIETCERFDHQKVTAQLSKLVRMAHDRNADVFTTNYDRLVEVAATSIGIECADGFENGVTRPESRWNGEFIRGLKLVKLHGSVNWYEEVDTQHLFRLERGYSLPSSDYRLTHGSRALKPLMIIPTLEKAILKSPYVGLLTQFSDSLRDTDFFVVIGNSLRDDHLRNTVAERARAGSLQIILVNPAAADQVDIVGRPDVTHALPIGIDEFIEFGLDSLNALLNEQATAAGGARGAAIRAYVESVNTRARQSKSMSSEDQRILASLNSGIQESQLAALSAINGSSDSALIDLVRRIVVDGVEESVRVAAIDALVLARGSDSAEILSEIVQKPGSLPVRAEAALALRSLDGAPAAEMIGRLREALANEKTIAMLLGS